MEKDLLLKRGLCIKRTSRLQPAKDLHIALGEFLSNNDPSTFESKKANLLIAIDSSEAEYNIQLEEITVLQNMSVEWDQQKHEMWRHQEALKEEFSELDREKSVFDEKKAEIEDLMAKYRLVVNDNTKRKEDENKETQIRNTSIEAEIDEYEEGNKRREKGLDMIDQGLKLFFNKKASAE